MIEVMRHIYQLNGYALRKNRLRAHSCNLARQDEIWIIIQLDRCRLSHRDTRQVFFKNIGGQDRLGRIGDDAKFLIDLQIVTNRPKDVVRGSFSFAQTAPHCFSASGIIVRNLATLNNLPRLPTRVCQKKSGPGDHSALPSATVGHSAAMTISPITATPTSIVLSTTRNIQPGGVALNGKETYQCCPTCSTGTRPVKRSYIKGMGVM